MNAKKWLALLLSLLLALGALTGCAGEKAPETPETEQTETESAEETEAPEEDEGEEAEDGIDYEAQYQAAMAKLQKARAKYDADTVVCTIEGQDITWGMLFYFIAQDLQDMIYYTGDIPADFNEPLNEEATIGQYFKKSAVSQAVYYAVANAVPVAREIPIPEEVETTISEYWDQLLESYGSEEELLEAMSEAGLDRDLLFFFLRSNEGLNAVRTALYDADSLPTEEVISWAAEKGYVRTKHILYSFYNEDGTPMDDEGKAAQRTKADAVYAELSALTGDHEALEKRFDEIMTGDTTDPGVENFPMGYTFTAGTMVTEYEDAAFALADYGLSEVVETSYGYHILLRLPLDPDGLTMDQDSSTGAYMTLRQTAANERFNADLTEWINSAEVVWADPVFEELDFNALFDIVPTETPAQGDETGELPE